MTTIKLIPTTKNGDTELTAEQFLTRVVTSINDQLRDWDNENRFSSDTFKFEDGKERKFLTFNKVNRAKESVELKEGFTPSDVLTAAAKLVDFYTLFQANDNMITMFRIELV